MPCQVIISAIIININNFYSSLFLYTCIFDHYFQLGAFFMTITTSFHCYTPVSWSWNIIQCYEFSGFWYHYNETGHQYNSGTNPLPVLHIYEVTHVGKTFSYNRLIMGGFLWCQNWSSIPSCFMYIFSLSIMLTVIIIKMYCCVGKPSKKDETV